MSGNRRLGSNFKSAAFRQFRENLPKTPGFSKPYELDIFHYIYSVLPSSRLPGRYADFLKTDFPRVPLTGNLELFHALSKLGGELVALHLIESLKLDKPFTGYTGPANSEVEKISHARGTVWLDKAQTIGFRGVPEALWTFHIGGY